jgi:hypothetical protein
MGVDLENYDPDLAAVRLKAEAVNIEGIYALVDRLMNYRRLVRQAFDYVDAQARQSEGTTSIYRLKDHIGAINSRLSELQWSLDLDHVDIAELTDDG